jgi:hypothetical protein
MNVQSTPAPNKRMKPIAPAVAFLALAILTNAFPIYECLPHKGGG